MRFYLNSIKKMRVLIWFFFKKRHFLHGLLSISAVVSQGGRGPARKVRKNRKWAGNYVPKNVVLRRILDMATGPGGLGVKKQVAPFSRPWNPTQNSLKRGFWGARKWILGPREEETRKKRDLEISLELEKMPKNYQKLP